MQINKKIIAVGSIIGIKEIPYEIKGGEIYLSAEGESVKGFEIKGDTLIMYDIGNIMDEAVLKKK